MTTPTEPREGVFDPEIHATDEDGNPKMNKDGTFRKKRKDAGRKVSAPSAGSKAPSGARSRHHRAVTDALALPVAGLSLADPVLGFAAGSVAPMWADALADMAVDSPRLAAALEKVAGLGSAGGLITVAVVTGVQFGILLGKLPDQVAGMLPGVRTRAEIEAILDQRGAQMREVAETRAAMAAQMAAADQRTAEAGQHAA